MNSNNLDIIFLVNILDVDSWIQSKTEDDSSLMHRRIWFDNECIIIVTENLNFIKNVNIRFVYHFLFISKLHFSIRIDDRISMFIIYLCESCIRWLVKYYVDHLFVKSIMQSHKMISLEYIDCRLILISTITKSLRFISY